MHALENKTSVIATLVLLLWSLPCSAEITKEQQAELNRINGFYREAGKSYNEGDYKAAGKAIQEAHSRLVKLVTESEDPAVYQKTSSLFTNIGKAYALLELEGIPLPRFQRPEPPAPKPTKPADPVPEGGVSFTKEIAPILVKNCGQCHVTGMRGDFSMATYEALMKGPEVGVVVIPGKPAGSRLIEVVDTGAMPPNGRGIPAAELEKLVQWVSAGAKFDGDAPDTQLPEFAAGVNPPQRAPAPTIRAATGKETVSFAKDVASILIDNCKGCHIDAMQTQGGLRMDTFAQLNRGGDSGPIIAPGDADKSLLIKRLKGEEGMRMPAGGRPALSDEQITLISTWIKEGATLDGAGPDQPLRIMTALAWAQSASHEELMERRMEIASQNWRTGSPDAEPKIVETDNFYIVGSVGPNTLDAVAKQAEAALESIQDIVKRPRPTKESQFKGRVSIFVFPRRYDYSEFGSMIEKRSLPTDWQEHWRYDGVDAYLALVVTPNDEDEDIKSRLIGPMASVSLAQVGGVPDWMSEGVGMAARARLASRDDETVRQWDEMLPPALASLQKPDQLLKNQLTPEQSRLISYGIGQFLLARGKAGLDKFVKNMAGGAKFQLAFAQSFGGEPQDLVTASVNWCKSQGLGRRR